MTVGPPDRFPKHAVVYLVILGFLGTTLIVFSDCFPVRADDGMLVTPVSYDRTPAYGSYTLRQGRLYGRAMPVRTENEALRLLKSYYGPRGLRVDNLLEHPAYYEAHIARGAIVVDRVILLKRTGRIRSVY